MASKYKDLGNGIRLRVGRLTVEEERQCYKDSTPVNGAVIFHRPRKDKNPKKPT